MSEDDSDGGKAGDKKDDEKKEDDESKVQPEKSMEEICQENNITRKRDMLDIELNVLMLQIEERQFTESIIAKFFERTVKKYKLPKIKNASLLVKFFSLKFLDNASGKNKIKQVVHNISSLFGADATTLHLFFDIMLSSNPVEVRQSVHKLMRLVSASHNKDSDQLGSHNFAEFVANQMEVVEDLPKDV